MPTRNVVLTDHHERLITDLVTSGRYQNASEILREGLRLIEIRDAREAKALQALQAAAQLGINDIEAGNFQAFDSFDDMEAYLRETTGKIIAQAPNQPLSSPIQHPKPRSPQPPTAPHKR